MGIKKNDESGDAHWPSRQKSICVNCEKTIALYADQWLHVITGEKNCDLPRTKAQPSLDRWK